MTFNITPKRLIALSFNGQRPGVLVGCVADHVLVRMRHDGSVRSMWSQAATRSGAGCCKQLANASRHSLDVVLARCECAA